MLCVRERSLATNLSSKDLLIPPPNLPLEWIFLHFFIMGIIREPHVPSFFEEKNENGILKVQKI
jgi:hypothetical protein